MSVLNQTKSRLVKNHKNSFKWPSDERDGISDSRWYHFTFSLTKLKWNYPCFSVFTWTFSLQVTRAFMQHEKIYLFMAEKWRHFPNCKCDYGLNSILWIGHNLKFKYRQQFIEITLIYYWNQPLHYLDNKDITYWSIVFLIDVFIDWLIFGLDCFKNWYKCDQ